MIKIIFLFITIMHGLIHIMGFVKAFNLAEIDQLVQSISKPVGLIWLLASLLFLATAVLFLLNKEWWWMLGIVAVIVSQGLIISSWQDAKYGTILNIIVIIAIILGFGAWSFNRQVDKEVNTIAAQEKVEKEIIVTEEMLDSLPQPVQRWYPSAAFSPFISWETVDEQSAKATMTYKGVSGSVIFHFNKQGDFKKITAQRYKDSDEKAELKKWIGEVKETSVVNGIKIPIKMDVS